MARYQTYKRQALNPNGSIATLETGLTGIPLSPGNLEPAGVSFTGEDFHMKTPYTQGYNFTLQYQLTLNQTVQAAYVGNTVRHLGVSGDSYYNSLQLNYERRFAAGLSVLANFTYSKCRTDAVDVLNATALTGFRAAELPGFGIQGDYGLCDFDIPKVVHLSGEYDLPFGNGRHYLNGSSRAVNALLGGWSTNWILTLQDGQRFTVPCSGATTTSGFGCNALLVPGQSVIAGPHNVNDWLNAAAFASPPVATAIGQSNYAPLGGAPSQFYCPGFHRMDFSAFKTFRTTDITSTRDGQNDQREIRFALKFYF